MGTMFSDNIYAMGPERLCLRRIRKICELHGFWHFAVAKTCTRKGNMGWISGIL